MVNPLQNTEAISVRKLVQMAVTELEGIQDGTPDPGRQGCGWDSLSVKGFQHAHQLVLTPVAGPNLPQVRLPLGRATGGLVRLVRSVQPVHRVVVVPGLPCSAILPLRSRVHAPVISFGFVPASAGLAGQASDETGSHAASGLWT